MRYAGSSVVLFSGVIRADLSQQGLRRQRIDGLRLLNRARVRSPVDTGNMRNSHQLRTYVRQLPRWCIVAEVYTRVNYARAVHGGRRAVVIRPVHAQWLRFYWKGRWHYRKVVHQPPRRGKPWLLKALREVGRERGYKISTEAPWYRWLANP